MFKYRVCKARKRQYFCCLTLLIDCYQPNRAYNDERMMKRTPRTKTMLGASQGVPWTKKTKVFTLTWVQLGFCEEDESLFTSYCRNSQRLLGRHCSRAVCCRKNSAVFSSTSLGIVRTGQGTLSEPSVVTSVAPARGRTGDPSVLTKKWVVEDQRSCSQTETRERLLPQFTHSSWSTDRKMRIFSTLVTCLILK